MFFITDIVITICSKESESESESRALFKSISLLFECPVEDSPAIYPIEHCGPAIIASPVTMACRASNVRTWLLLLLICFCEPCRVA